MKTALIGKQLGDYTLVRLLATGGMSRIYEGVDRRLDRRSAIKVLDLETDYPDADDMQVRFEREARALAKLEHPNIVPIYQFGEEEGLYFIAMKLIEGSDLAQELKELRKLGTYMEPARALPILEQVASALDAAHNAHIVHRDVKPSNILIDLHDRATLTDFGLVIQPSVDSTYGTAFGTPRYISPEQATDSSLAVPQSDIYSLGVIVYEILTGQTPFDGKSPMEIALSHINDAPPPPRSINALIPLEVERAVLKALAKEPGRRFNTAGEFISAVRKGYRDAGIVADDTTELPPTGAKPGVSAAALRNAQEAKQSADTLRRNLIIAGVFLAIAAVIVVILLLTRSASTLSPTDLTMTSVASTNVAGTGIQPETMTADAARIQTAVANAANQSATQAANGGAPLIVPTDLHDTAAALELFYDDVSLTLVNHSTTDVPVSSLALVRGTGGFTGDRIPRGVLPAGTCFRIVLQGRQVSLPPGCQSLHSELAVRDASALFWRSSDVPGDEFSLWIGDQVLVVCPTVLRGEATLTCAPQVDTTGG